MPRPGTASAPALVIQAESVRSGSATGTLRTRVGTPGAVRMVKTSRWAVALQEPAGRVRGDDGGCLEDAVAAGRARLLCGEGRGVHGQGRERVTGESSALVAAGESMSTRQARVTAPGQGLHRPADV